MAGGDFVLLHPDTELVEDQLRHITGDSFPPLFQLLFGSNLVVGLQRRDHKLALERPLVMEVALVFQGSGPLLQILDSRAVVLSSLLQHGLDQVH